jgi:molecular chaperone DnaJ
VAEREWFDKDYYKVLGLTSSATDKEITRAYRKLAKQFHPDTHPGSEDKFKEISVAYDVLGDDVKRKEYDEVRRLGPAASGPAASTFKRATSRTSGISSADSLATRGASAPRPNVAPI